MSDAGVTQLFALFLLALCTLIWIVWELVRWRDDDD